MSLFRSQTNLFENIACPSGEGCTLGNCIYSHTGQATQRELAKPRVGDSGLKRISDSNSGQTPQLKKQALPTASKPASKPLTPAILGSPPAQHRQRVQYVHVIRDKLVEHGYSNADDRAIDIEKQVAQRSTQFTYAMGIRSAVREITTGQLDKEAERQQRAEENADKIYRSELVNLLVPLRELEKRRYVLTKPDARPLESTETRPCARCSTRVPVYELSTRTAPCKFHLLKRQYDPAIKALSPVFPCCGETVDEGSGCESRDFHVYKLEAPSEMEAMLPFRETPNDGDGPAKEFAVGIDCEMGWTTRGFELIRVTVVGYITRTTIFDRLVWPRGRILDLNTRFSGVSDMESGTVVDGKVLPALKLEEMYSELFKLIGSRTILIGHGLENDLNAMRLIHHRIVDTAILFPRIKQRTHSLKELAWDFLSRSIQTGEHDSMEDSLAAIDIIRQDIKNRCMKGEVKSFK